MQLGLRFDVVTFTDRRGRRQARPSLFTRSGFGMNPMGKRQKSSRNLLFVDLSGASLAAMARFA